MIRSLIFIMLVSLLTACGTPPQRQPLALQQAQTADKEARRALRMGDTANARIAFAESLSRYQSLDDRDGAASARLSLAAVSHQLHDDAAAIKLLDELLLDQDHVYARGWQIAAAFRKAVILAGSERVDEALPVLAIADRLCERDCDLRFGIEVVKARLTLLKGDALAALALAQPVATARDVSNDERANALRVVAAAEERLTRHEAALSHYRGALELDKALGLSGRIEDDLNGMARALTQLGKKAEAATHARRAALVREGARRDAVPSAAH